MRPLILAAALAAASPALTQTGPTPPTASTEIDPARLAAAERLATALVPSGTYLRMMRGQFPTMADAMMGQMMGMTATALSKEGAEDDLRRGEAIAKADPHFRERMTIMSRVMAEEMSVVFDKIERRLRVALSRAFGRKFTTAQSTELADFFGTPTGKAFSDEYLATFMEPEVMQELVTAIPELMKAMPAIMAKVEMATAHLPPRPKQDASND